MAVVDGGPIGKEKKPVRTAFGARNLDTGDTIGVPGASAFAFSVDG